MRFLGPRSLSSLIKTALDVLYSGLLIVLIIDIVGLIGVISMPNLAMEAAQQSQLGPNVGSARALTPRDMAMVMGAFAVSLGGYVLILRWMRQIFVTMAEGAIFHAANVWRLRFIGFGLAGLELFGDGVRLMINHVSGLEVEAGYGMRAVTTWFSVMVVFVLAEVFREGARLSRESELTV